MLEWLTNLQVGAYGVRDESRDQKDDAKENKEAKDDAKSSVSDE